MFLINKKRLVRVGLAAGAAAFLFGLWYTLFRVGSLARLRTEERPELQVTLDDPDPDEVSPQLVRISGKATAACKVFLEVNTFHYACRDTESDNSFKFENVVLGPGANTISVKAVQAEGLRKYESLPAEVQVVLQPATDPTAADRMTGEDGVFVYTSNKMPTPIKRAVTAEVSYRQLKVKTETVLPMHDKRVALINEKNGAEDNPVREEERYKHFTRAVFGDLAIGDPAFGVVPIAQFCRKGSDNSKEGGDNVGNGNVTVTAECPLAAGSFFKQKFDQHWQIRTDWRAPYSGEDSFWLVVSDYILKIPDRTRVTNYADAGNSAKWVRGQKGAAPSGEGEAKLVYRIGGTADDILRTLRASLYHLAPPKLIAVLQFAAGLLLAIPLIWARRFLRKHPASGRVSDASSRRVKRAAAWLLPFLFVEAVIYGANTVSSVVANRQSPNVASWWTARLLTVGVNELSSTDFRVYLISLLLMATVGGVLLLLTQWGFSDLAPIFWARNVLRSICVATLATVFLFVGVGFALYLLQPNVVNLPHILARLAVWLFLILLSDQALRLTRPLLGKRTRSKPWGRVALALLLLTPLLLSSDLFDVYGGNVFAAAPHVTVFEEVRAGLALAQRLVPYVFLLGLLSLLKEAGRADSGEAESGWARELGVILFAAYVVSSTLEWLMIPLATIGAYVAYNRWLMLDDARLKLLGGLRPKVVREREGWAGKILKVLEVYEAESKLAEYTKKSRKGDLQPEDLEASRVEAQKTFDAAKPIIAVEGETRVDDVFLSIGPTGSNWGDGVHAAKLGFWLSLPLLAGFLIRTLPEAFDYQGQFAVLAFFMRTTAFVAYWAAAAFFFGYFFMCLRGSTGLWKGVWVALLVIACTMLSDLGMKERLIYAGQHLFFFTALGGCGFDYKITKRTLGGQLGWGKLFQLEIGRRLSPNSIVFALLMLLGTGLTSNGLNFLFKKITEAMVGEGS